MWVKFQGDMFLGAHVSIKAHLLICFKGANASLCDVFETNGFEKAWVYMF
jgi:hypothetical protein